MRAIRSRLLLQELCFLVVDDWPWAWEHGLWSSCSREGWQEEPCSILAELDQCYSRQSSYHHCNMIASSIKSGISMPDRGNDSSDEADMALLLAV